MAAADKKITYTAAEVAELIRPLAQSVELLQKENAELKRKLEHMNEVFANAQRAQYGQSSEKKTYVLNEDQLNFFNEAEDCQDHKAEELTGSRHYTGAVTDIFCCTKEYPTEDSSGPGQKQNYGCWIHRVFVGSWKDFVSNRKLLSEKENQRIYSD